MTVDNDNVND